MESPLNSLTVREGRLLCWSPAVLGGKDLSNGRIIIQAFGHVITYNVQLSRERHKACQEAGRHPKTT